jgi:hypothetical protein
MHFLEHYISWPVIKSYLIFNVTCQIQYFLAQYETHKTCKKQIFEIKFSFSCMFKINKHKFNNYISSIILFEFRYKSLIFFFIIIEFSIKPSCDPASDHLPPESGNHCSKRMKMALCEPKNVAVIVFLTVKGWFLRLFITNFV